jgi:hypothetical protein
MRRLLVSLFAGAVVIPVVQALTSAHTFRPAGEGVAAISGYTVSQVQYTPDPSDPGTLASVSFAIAPAQARTVKVRLNAHDGWHSCSVATGRASCLLGPGELRFAAVTVLYVIAL